MFFSTTIVSLAANSRAAAVCVFSVLLIALSPQSAQSLGLEKVGGVRVISDSASLPYAPGSATIKDNGITFLRGSQAYFLPDDGPGVLLSNSAVGISSTKMEQFHVVLERSLQESVAITTAYYRGDGTPIVVPLAEIRGYDRHNIYGESEGGHAATYNVAEGTVSEVSLLVQQDTYFAQTLQSQPEWPDFFPPFSERSVKPLWLHAIENEIVYGVAPRINFLDEHELPPDSGFDFELASNLERTSGPFALFPDGTTKWIRLPSRNSFLVENGFIFNPYFRSFTTVDTLDSVLTPSLLTRIIGGSAEEGFGFGVLTDENDNELDVISLFSVQDGDQIASLDLGGKIYDAEYLGDGRFQYLAENDGYLVSGEFRVVPLPAAAWFFLMALSSICALRSFGRAG